MLYYAIISVGLIIGNRADFLDKCTADANCTTGGATKCWTLPSWCTFPCASYADCALFGWGCASGMCQTCKTDADCGGGSNTCSGGKCLISCHTDGDCCELCGQVCDNHWLCIKPQGRSCAADADCDGNSKCEGDFPDQKCTNDGTCDTVGDCIDPRETCIDGECDVDMFCQSDADCTNAGGWNKCSLASGATTGRCYLECAVDADCQANMFMLMSGWVCRNGVSYLGCDGCMMCAPADLPTTCTDPAECAVVFNASDPIHAKCDTNGGCYYECTTNADCAMAHDGVSSICYENTVTGYKQCVWGSVACTSDADCGLPKNKCLDGSALSPAIDNVCYRGCWNDGDCVPPETCQTNVVMGMRKCAQACANDGDCAVWLFGYLCNGGYCYAPCANDGDCSTLRLDAECVTINGVSFCDGVRIGQTPQPSVSPTVTTTQPSAAPTVSTQPPTMTPSVSPTTKAADVDASGIAAEHKLITAFIVIVGVVSWM